MNTTIEDRDLTQQPPHSPGERIGGFVILARAVDKCRASLNHKLGEYHFDCPLDNKLFGFKGIKGDQFKKVVASAKTYEDVSTWLAANGTKKSPEEIKKWSDEVEHFKLKAQFANSDQKSVRESCQKLGLDFESATLFEWLEADDEASFEHHAVAGK
jgi:hypothetical protein